MAGWGGSFTADCYKSETDRMRYGHLNRKLVGHYNYFGVRSNEKALHSFYQWTIGCAYKWLNRRGGKRRSFTWAQFNAALKKLEVAWPRTAEKARAHVVFA